MQVLKGVRARTTFCDGDSNHKDLADLATCDHYAHVSVMVVVVVVVMVMMTVIVVMALMVATMVMV